MNAPDDANLLAKITAGLGTALTALGVWAWNHTHRRIDRVETDKAAKAELERLCKRVESHTIGKDAFEEHVKSDERQLAALHTEIGVQRGNISKVFDKLEDVREDMHKWHTELLNAIHSIKSEK